VLVPHVAHDLLDEVLERHDADDVAPLVDHHGHLQTAAPQLLQQRVQLDRGRHERGGEHHVVDPDLLAALVRDGHRMLDVDGPDDLLAVAREHGKARAAALAGTAQDVGHRSAGPHHVHRPAGGHHVRGAAVPERQRALHQRCRGRLQGPLLGRAAHERRQLLRRPRGGKLLLRLDAHAAHDRVRRLVEEADRECGHAREAALKALHRPGGLQRPGDRQVLRDQLPEDHREPRRHHQRDDERHPGRRSARDADRGERTGHQIGDRGLGQKPDEQVRHRDPHLRGRELGRQRPKRRADPLGTAIPAVGGAIHRRAVDGDERELGRDERATSRHERERQDDEQDLDHRAPPAPVRRARRGLLLGSSLDDGKVALTARA